MLVTRKCPHAQFCEFAAEPSRQIAISSGGIFQTNPRAGSLAVAGNRLFYAPLYLSYVERQ